MQVSAEASEDKGYKSFYPRLSGTGFSFQRLHLSILRGGLTKNGMRNSKISRTEQSYGQASLMAKFWRWKLDQQKKAGEISGIFSRSPTAMIKFIREETIRKEDSNHNKKTLVKDKYHSWKRLA